MSRGLNQPKSAKTWFKFSAGLNFETFDTILSGSRDLNSNRRSNSLNSASGCLIIGIKDKIATKKFNLKSIKQASLNSSSHHTHFKIISKYSISLFWNKKNNLGYLITPLKYVPTGECKRARAPPLTDIG